MKAPRHRDCVQLFMAVDDDVAVRSTIVGDGLTFGVAPDGFAGATGELLEVRLGACACAFVKQPGRLVEVIHRLLASERRVQVLLVSKGVEPALTRSPATVLARELFAGGAALLPRDEVVERPRRVVRSGRQISFASCS